MTDPSTTLDVHLAQLRGDLYRAQAALHDAVQRACPADVHKPTQHRDAQMPWCNTCGRSASGLMLGKPR